LVGVTQPKDLSSGRARNEVDAIRLKRDEAPAGTDDGFNLYPADLRDFC
jgi:hypothetical protein